MKRIMILIGIVLMVGVLYSTKTVPLDLDGRAAWIEVEKILPVPFFPSFN